MAQSTTGLKRIDGDSHFFPPVDFTDVAETLNVTEAAVEMLLRDSAVFTDREARRGGFRASDAGKSVSAINPTERTTSAGSGPIGHGAFCLCRQRGTRAAQGDQPEARCGRNQSRSFPPANAVVFTRRIHQGPVFVCRKSDQAVRIIRRTPNPSSAVPSKSNVPGSGTISAVNSQSDAYRCVSQDPPLP